MKNYLSLIMIVLCFSFSKGFSQQDPKAETNRMMDLLNKLEGTYQVQIIDSRELPAIPLSLMDTIIAKRDQEITKYVWLKNNIRVKILSVKEITSPSFKGVTRVDYVNSTQLN
jgi:VanZ family protein